MENHTPIQGVYLVGGLRFHRDFTTFLNAIEQAFIGGIRLFQLRVKDELSDQEHLELAKKVRMLTLTYNVTYLINDRPDIAVLCDADGVHVGPDDMPVEEVRKIIGDKIVGRSSHSLQQAESALNEPISYLSVGPVFETDCKKAPDETVGHELVSEVLMKSHIPIVAIGGITKDNMKNVCSTGVSCIGVIRDIMAAPDLKEASQSFIQAFREREVKK